MFVHSPSPAAQQTPNSETTNKMLETRDSEALFCHSNGSLWPYNLSLWIIFSQTSTSDCERVTIWKLDARLMLFQTRLGDLMVSFINYKKRGLAQPRTVFRWVGDLQHLQFHLHNTKDQLSWTIMTKDCVLKYPCFNSMRRWCFL